MTFLILPTIVSAQSVNLARQRMSEGKYESARIYWEALDDHGEYAKDIETCQMCHTLQQEAIKLVKKGQYGKAIGKYDEILSLNPMDKDAKKQIAKYRKLFDTTTAVPYSNPIFGYSISYPRYLKRKSSPAVSDKIRFASDDKYDIQLNIDSRTDYDNLSTPVYKLLKKEVDAYLTNNRVNASTITVNIIKNNWMAISGKFTDGKIFYNKTFIVTRKTSAGQYYRAIVSAVAISSKEDVRGNQLADCIAISFRVNSGTFVTDEIIWGEAEKCNTKAAYQKYLDISGADGKHRTEAQATINLMEARENYDAERYSEAKLCYEHAKSYYTLGTKDAARYAKACEETEYKQIVHWYEQMYPDLNKLLNFKKNYPESPHITEINGLIVKTYCKSGDFKAAQNFVDECWPNLLTPETKMPNQSKAFWKGLIRQYRRPEVGHMWEFGVDWRCNGKSYWGANAAFCVGTLENRFNLDFRINPSITFSKKLDKQMYPRWFCPITMGTRLYLNPGHGEDWFCYVEPEVGYSINASGVFGGRFVFGYDIVGVNIGGLWTMTSMPYNLSNSKFVYAGIGINIYIW